MTPKEKRKKAQDAFDRKHKAVLTKEQEAKMNAIKAEARKYEKGSDKYEELMADALVIEVFGGTLSLD